ncbi:AB hydrolase-1 domain-containing protein [Citrus sinensis]|uniref:AB hydrolase-1 domain-containing protein n=1 Tax=Citrus sinensis TaxID=2711 RepID=A0ACB8N1H5_CITSI|nr:AB hydrolase-1 domain-containing protein [Citrus sinensis]
MTTAVGACVFSADSSLAFRRDMTPSSSGNAKRNPMSKRLAVPTATATTGKIETTSKTMRSFVEKTSSELEADTKQRIKLEKYSSESEEQEGNSRKWLKDYFDEAKDMIKSDGGPPRWFSPLECGSHNRNSRSPLLLFLPGLLKLIERTIRSENCRSSNRPVYLVGESLGACLALAVAARNPDMDLVLILANPATSFRKSLLQTIMPIPAELMSGQMTLTLSYLLSLLTGDPLKMAMDSIVKGLFLQSTIQERSQDFVAMSSYLPVGLNSVLANILPKETLLWKLELLKSASAYANARLDAVKAQTLILCSGRDQLLPSEEEGDRLCRALPNCQTRSRFHSGFARAWQEDGVDLVTTIKGAGYYRRGRIVDYVSDFIPPTTIEVNKVYEEYRWMVDLTSSVMLSTLPDGKIVRGLSGIPSEGPVLLVGNHMLLGLEALPMVPTFMIERNILVRAIAHPMVFFNAKDGGLPDLVTYDTFRIMGSVPVSAINFYKLVSSKAHVLLYPGGVREAFHRKGEEYKLFWPESSEFVRVAAAFGGKIVPFGVVGEDDLAQIVVDYNDQMKIPYLRSRIEEQTEKVVSLRTDTGGEVANQAMHVPFYIPKVPGRLYYYFGKPIETKGRKQELRDKKKAQELYLQVKSEVEKCIAYLKEKRESDPYRNILSRLIHQAAHGLTSQIPTFEL